MGFLTALAISLGVGAITGLANTAYQHWQYKDQKAYNSAEAQKNRDQNFEHNKEMAKEQHKLNVEGMKEAGLNPALMYSSGGNGVSSASANSAASISAGGGVDILNGLTGIVNSAANVLSVSKPNSQPYKIATKMLTSAGKIIK